MMMLQSLRHILIIDDNPRDSELLALAFAEHGGGLPVELHAVDNAVQAFEFLTKRRTFRDAPTPDLIVLDLHMPVINGHRFLRELSLDAQLKDRPVVVLSSSDAPSDRELASQLGARSYLVKPLHFAGYAEIVEQLTTLLAGLE